jgi:hypothetical protein
MQFTPEPEGIPVTKKFIDAKINPRVDKWSKPASSQHELFKRMGENRHVAGWASTTPISACSSRPWATSSAWPNPIRQVGH